MCSFCTLFLFLNQLILAGGRHHRTARGRRTSALHCTREEDVGAALHAGFGLIYDNLESAKKFEPKYRLIRVRFVSRSFILRTELEFLSSLLTQGT